MNIKGHFDTITRHKLLVMKYCFACGLYEQGLAHDLSKYSPTEFIPGCIYYQEMCIRDSGYAVHERSQVQRPQGYGRPVLPQGHLAPEPHRRRQPGSTPPRRYLSLIHISRLSATSSTMQGKGCACSLRAGRTTLAQTTVTLSTSARSLMQLASRSLLCSMSRKLSLIHILRRRSRMRLRTNWIRQKARQRWTQSGTY